jgi:hypothetical protein
VNVFPEQLKCPDFVESQTIVRGKYTHANANGKGTDCHPQHDCMNLVFSRINVDPSGRIIAGRRFSRLLAI